MGMKVRGSPIELLAFQNCGHGV